MLSFSVTRVIVYLVGQVRLADSLLLLTTLQPHPACALPREAPAVVQTVMLDPPHTHTHTLTPLFTSAKALDMVGSGWLFPDNR